MNLFALWQGLGIASLYLLGLHSFAILVSHSVGGEQRICVARGNEFSFGDIVVVERVILCFSHVDWAWRASFDVPCLHNVSCLKVLCLLGMSAINVSDLDVVSDEFGFKWRNMFDLGEFILRVQRV